MPNGDGLREKVVFPANTAVEIQLGDLKPTLTPGRFGDEWQYFLGADKIAWLKPEVHAAIQATSPNPGDRFLITKRDAGTGKDRRITWTVERFEEEPWGGEAFAPPPAHEPKAAPPKPARARAPKTPQPAAALANQVPEFDIDIPGPAPAPLPAAVPVPHPAASAPMPASEADALLSALTTAINVAALAQAHAARRGLPLHFDAGDIRALASGLMIERRERSAWNARRAA